MKRPLQKRLSLVLASALSLPVVRTRAAAFSSVSLSGSVTVPESSSATENGKYFDEEVCPPCGLLFTKAVDVNEGGTPGNVSRVQEISLMERGEPKSGTGFMFEWAGGSLIHACDYLKEVFGESSCSVEWSVANDALGDLLTMEMKFNPRLAEVNGDGSHCCCEGVDRVHISLARHFKHELPIQRGCGLYHTGGIEPEGSSACTFANGTQPENFDELWHCMEEADCEPNDSRQQMAVFRDPRPTVVSTYFFLEEHKMIHNGETVDEYVVRMLPTICQWLAVRFILFEGVMADQTDMYWFEDAVVDPLQWHYDWLTSVGLQLPFEVVEATTDAALRQDFVFPTKGVDVHPGGETTETHRSYESEITEETRASFDPVLRTWLPPAVLARLEVPPL